MRIFFKFNAVLFLSEVQVLFNVLQAVHEIHKRQLNREVLRKHVEQHQAILAA